MSICLSPDYFKRHSTFANLKKLRVLEIRDGPSWGQGAEPFFDRAKMPLVEFPNITNLTALENLSIVGTHISSIPPTISNLINLRRLMLYDNEIPSIPAYIKKLPKLKGGLMREDPVGT